MKRLCGGLKRIRSQYTRRYSFFRTTMLEVIILVLFLSHPLYFLFACFSTYIHIRALCFLICVGQLIPRWIYCNASQLLSEESNHPLYTYRSKLNDIFNVCKVPYQVSRVYFRFLRYLNNQDKFKAFLSVMFSREFL